MKLQNEDGIARKHFNAVMNWTEPRMGEKVLREKLFVLYCTNTDKVQIFPVLHDKVALLMTIWAGNKKLSPKNF